MSSATVGTITWPAEHEKVRARVLTDTENQGLRNQA
jgi:hypothetical protein